MMTRTLLATLLLAALALSLGGAQAQEGRTISIQAVLHETSFGLHMVPERIDARVGDTLQVEVINGGAAKHNLVFCGDTPGGSGACRDKWAATPLLDGGASTNITVNVEKAGTFDFFCDLPGHREGGMNGEMIAQEAPGGTKKVPGPAPVLAALVAALGALALSRRCAQ